MPGATPYVKPTSPPVYGVPGSPKAPSRYNYNDIGGRVLNPNYEAELTEYEKAQRGSAFETALSASKAGIGYNTGFTSPTSGAHYNFSGSGSGGSGSGAGGGSGSGARDVDFTSAWDKTRTITPPPPIPLPARVAPISMEDRAAAERAEFSKAKDIIGRTGRASLNALASEMRGRGISGSGIHAERMGTLTGQAAGQLGGVGLTQAIEALKRQAQIADQNYQGEVSQRSQDIGYNSSLNSRDMQTLNERSSMTKTLLDLMQRNGGRLY